MKLSDILDLHPGAEAGSGALGLALAAASIRRDELLAEADAADQERRAGLLTLDEKALTAIEKTAGVARLAADRIEAMLPQLRADLAVARGRETVAELKTLAETVEQRIIAMTEWQTETYPQLAKLIGAGLHAEAAAVDAYAEFAARVDSEFRRQEVRDAAPGGVNVSAPSGARPSHLFPNWDRAHG